MRHIIFTPDRNSRKADGTMDNDFTGAFEPESKRYAKYWRGLGDEIVIQAIDVSQHVNARLNKMLSVIENGAPVDRLAFFCHGWKTGIQMGLSVTELTLVPFIRRLVATSTPELKVALYACSTGASDGPAGDGGDTGFADVFRDMLCRAGRPNVSVFAHTSAGHTTRNPHVRFFFGAPDGAYGGDDVVGRKTPQFAKLRAKLNDGSDFRWRVPYMTRDELLAELS